MKVQQVPVPAGTSEQSDAEREMFINAAVEGNTVLKQIFVYWWLSADVHQSLGLTESVWLVPGTGDDE